MPAVALGFALIVIIFVLVPIGFILGLLISNKTSPAKEEKSGCLPKLIYAIVFSILFPVFICVIALGYEIYSSTFDYWGYEGAYDFWRMPLEEPYELNMIDSLDQASINIWNGSMDVEISNITKYDKKDHLVAGDCRSGWFLFNCTTGKVKHFTTEESLKTACAKEHFSPIQLKSIQENWDLYWNNPKHSNSFTCLIIIIIVLALIGFILVRQFSNKKTTVAETAKIIDEK